MSAAGYVELALIVVLILLVWRHIVFRRRFARLERLCERSFGVLVGRLDALEADRAVVRKSKRRFWKHLPDAAAPVGRPADLSQLNSYQRGNIASVRAVEPTPVWAEPVLSAPSASKTGGSAADRDNYLHA